MIPKTIFDVNLAAEHKLEADNSTEAIQKTIEYFAAHIGEINFTWTQETVYVAEPEE